MSEHKLIPSKATKSTLGECEVNSVLCMSFYFDVVVIFCISEKTYTRWRCYQHFTKVIMED